MFLLVASFGNSFGQQSSPNALLRNFTSPGNAARPRVWWHWMKGNVTKDGIRKDLFWMSRSGIGGFQNFDAALATPQIVAKPLNYMTPEWKDAFRYTTKLADSLGLEMAIAGSPGWSESGGPWVKPKDGMKKIVWSELRVEGGQPFNGVLPKLPVTTGVFQNIPFQPGFGAAPGEAPIQYSGDIAVIAYRLPQADISMTGLNAKVSSSGGNFTLLQLTDGDLATGNMLPSDTVKGYAWIQYEFPQPQTIKAVTVVGGGARGVFGISAPSDNRSLEVSDDGVGFRKVAFLPAGGVAEQTLNIPPTTAKYFRVTFKNPPAPMSMATLMGNGQPPKAPAGTEIAELVLHPVTRIDRFEEKAGFAAAYDLAKHPTPATDDVVAKDDVIDITSKVGADGSLNWTPPAGNWNIIRFGYSLTGKQNHPASPEATGLEVDKLNGRAIKDYFETYLNQYRDATGGLMGKRGLQYVVTDSYEAGQNNWTDGFAQEFQKRRGYNMLVWMPVLTGQVIKSSDESEKFLWDFRKTISELIAENHYDQLTDILAKYGMKRYTESHENGRVFIVDGMDVKRRSAVPMAAMWTNGGSSNVMAQADIRESASTAHIYGQNLVAAESLTAAGFSNNAWSYHPGNLKPTADLELASGLNRFVIHTSVHQPVDDKIPGLGLGPFGQWFTRHETWANQAKAWTDYLARSSYMLQQGKFVADIVYYYGEDNNITGLFGARLPDIPEGYSYDFINSDALIRLLSVKDGKLVTPSGMSYRLLVLDSNASKMTLPVLRKIAQLSREGAVIAGIKPEMTPSQKDDASEFNRVLAEVWEGQHGSKASASGKLYTGKALQEVLDDLKIAPDFSYTKPQDDSKLMFVHRRLIDADIYWINNRKDRSETFEGVFRITGKQPRIWHPETGKTEPASYTIANGVTRVELPLTPNDAVFVVFQAAATKAALHLPAKTETDMVALDGPWEVAFQANRGAPAKASFDNLVSYTENSDPGIKYFSGTATYVKTFNVPANAINKNTQTWLDLGDVKNLAEVTLNGKPLGVVWKQPFRVNLSGALKAGENKLEVKVMNAWVNRLIGDLQPGVTNKITYTTMPFYKPNAPLQPSGLLGPVKIVSVK